MSVNPSVIGKNMTSGNKTNWNVFVKKGKTLMKCNLGSGSSYLTQAKHILHIVTATVHCNKVKLLWIS